MLDRPVSPTSRPVGDGIRLVKDGVTYVDAASGTFNLPFGYNYQEVVDALVEQMQQGVHVSSAYSKELSSELAADLLQHAPANLGAAWIRDVVGSTANECAIKMAQKATGRRDVISLFLSHHGQTQFTTAVSGNSFRRKAFPDASSPYSVKVPAPYCHRCFYGAKYPSCGMMCVEKIADFLEYATSGSVACLIIEPILGNGGNIVPPPGYFEALQKLTTEHDLILIADEIQTGLGRTGNFFACETFNIKPAIMTLAKGLGGIGIPSAAVLMEDQLDVLESYEHSFTSGANILALTAARATLKILRDGRLLQNVRDHGPVLGDLLRALQLGDCGISDVRGVGYMWGIELSKADGSPDVERTNAVIARAARDENLIVRSSRYGFGNVIKVRPALIATAADLEEITTRLGRVLATTR